MREALLAAARAYAQAKRAPLRQVSRAAYGNSDFFEDLSRRRCSFTAETYDRIMAWFADATNWPEGKVPAAVVDLFAGVDKRGAPCPIKN